MPELMPAASIAGEAISTAWNMPIPVSIGIRLLTSDEPTGCEVFPPLTDSVICDGWEGNAAASSSIMPPSSLSARSEAERVSWGFGLIAGKRVNICALID